MKLTFLLQVLRERADRARRERPSGLRERLLDRVAERLAGDGTNPSGNNRSVR